MDISFRFTARAVFSLLLFLPLFSIAQVLERYPPGQEYYRGGWHSLNAEMKKIAKAQGLKPCANEDERYVMSVLVHPDGKANFVKDFDSITIQRNKCAYDMSRKLFSQLKGWTAPKADGIPVKAITTVNVIPYDLFNEKPKVLQNKIVQPQYYKGNDRFHYQVKKILESSISKNLDWRRVELVVMITAEGILESVEVRNIEISEISKKKLMSEVKAIKGSWKPATINGIPVSFRFIMTFQQQFNFELEKDKFDSYDRPYRGI